MKLIGKDIVIKTKNDAVKCFFLLRKKTMFSISECSKHYEINEDEILEILIKQSYDEGFMKRHNLRF